MAVQSSPAVLAPAAKRRGTARRTEDGAVRTSTRRRTQPTQRGRVLHHRVRSGRSDSGIHRRRPGPSPSGLRRGPRRRDRGEQSGIVGFGAVAWSRGEQGTPLIRVFSPGRSGQVDPLLMAPFCGHDPAETGNANWGRCRRTDRGGSHSPAITWRCLNRSASPAAAAWSGGEATGAGPARVRGDPGLGAAPPTPVVRQEREPAPGFGAGAPARHRGDDRGGGGSEAERGHRTHDRGHAEPAPHDGAGLAVAAPRAGTGAVLTPADAASLVQLEANIIAIEAGYQETAKPFEWKFTRADLDELLDRLSSLPRAA